MTIQFASRNRLLILLVLLPMLFPGNAVDAEEPSAPNVLIVIPDQMRGDALSAVDHPVVETPNLDRLAGKGFLARRAYAEVPSCIPARYAMLTGMSPQASGVVGYTGTRITRTTKPRAFKKAGYQTALVGRWMHMKNSANDLGYQEVVWGSVFRGKDYAQYMKKNLSSDSKHGKALHENGLRGMVRSMGVTYNYWQANPWPLKEELHPTSWTARRSREWIQKANDEQPMFLTTSFYAPHSPLFPPEKYFSKYMNENLPEPVYGDWVDQDALSPDGRLSNTRVLLQGDRLDRAQAGYFGLIEHIDSKVGPLFQDFIGKSRKTGRPWIIVFVSEHGEMLGDHGYYRKCEPYEGSANIPFIIAASEDMGLEAGTRSREPIGLQDLFPTLAGMTGVTLPDQADGISLVPLLKGRDQDVRNWLHLEHGPTYSSSQAFQALTDGRYKYIWRPLDGGKEQLFDLKNDPRERRNLADDPDYSEELNRWRNRLIKELEDRPEGFSDGEQLIPGGPFKAHMPGKKP